MRVCISAGNRAFVSIVSLSAMVSKHDTFYAYEWNCPNDRQSPRNFVGSQPVGRVVLMSIHPVYANAILKVATNKLSFRKRRLAPDVTHVLVYATAPVGAIVGAFVIAGQETSTPASYGDGLAVAGISHGKFFSTTRLACRHGHPCWVCPTPP